MNSCVKILFVVVAAIFITTTFTEAAKKKKAKDCVYCHKYEKMKDWPESERPVAFIWEDIDYPEGMFLKKNKEKLEEKFTLDLLKEKGH